ncbi:ATP-grasp domain-containing protein [Arcanobacterium phocisimile]|uniref:ATP-grasp domain-containing protein n=1 Tax=Arcanobacterium phocisimile TaxID=1302235 RepID=A0ABX7IGS6_9ACTO|nr:ATP-grasp domain-containing protein [Arcanobacterium phocisimile]QRV02331.1 ATP-grasp domain-containing protein [Arcanobacterium phocisimile]
MVVVPLILGTDENSYTQARAYHEAYGRQAVVCGAGILAPFYHTKIAQVHARAGFSSDVDVFAGLLNEVWASRNSDIDNFLMIAPTEEYLHMLYRALDLLDFSPVMPYPDAELGVALMDKSYFYARMKKLNIAVPQTLIAGPDNFSSQVLAGEQFIKADDYETFNSFDFPEKHKGFYAQNADEARDYLSAVFASGFTGNMLVQTFISGDNTQEFSVNGYRSADGRTVFVQARSVLTDTRPMWVGNHLLLTDTDRPDLQDLCQRAVGGLGYIGFFNIDFKADVNSDVPYMLEMNTRLGRSSYYGLLNGVNFVEHAINDAEGKEFPEVVRRPFSWITALRSQVANQLSGVALEYFMDTVRYANTGNALDYGFDDDPVRIQRLTKLRESIGRNLGW